MADFYAMRFVRIGVHVFNSAPLIGIGLRPLCAETFRDFALMVIDRREGANAPPPR